MRHPHPLNFQFTHREKSVISGVAKVDHSCSRATGLAGCIAPLHRHSAADKTVELAVVLHQRASEVDPRQLLDRLFCSGGGKVGVQSLQSYPHITHQHHIPIRRAPQVADVAHTPPLSRWERVMRSVG